VTLANAEVVERFVLHQEGKGKHLRSDGETLWSYRTPIARWTPIGLVCDVSWYSMTTATHQSILWHRCEWNFYPWDDLRGNIPLEELAKAKGVAVRRPRQKAGVRPRPPPRPSRGPPPRPANMSKKVVTASPPATAGR